MTPTQDNLLLALIAPVMLWILNHLSGSEGWTGWRPYVAVYALAFLFNSFIDILAGKL